MSKKLRIGLNATCFSSRPSGAKQRFIGVYTELFKLMHDCEFIVYEPIDFQIRDLFKDCNNVKYKVTPMKSYSRFQRNLAGFFYWRKEFLNSTFDIFETFNFPIFSYGDHISMITIHDLRGIHIEKSFIKKLFYKFSYNYTIQKSDVVITVSEFMKNELLKYFPKANIRVLYNGIDEKFFYRNNISMKLQKEILFEKYHLPDNYCLSVGHFEKRKNYSNLILAIEILKKNMRPFPLIIVGNDSGEMQNLRRLISDKGLEKLIFLLEAITDKELEILYRNSKFFIFPSTYEGFGIPIIEAMKFNIPCVLSDIEIFREIGIQDYLYFNPEDPSSIANTILLAVDKNKKIPKTSVFEKFKFYNLAKNLKDIYYGVLN